jgi:hypothetical protein
VWTIVVQSPNGQELKRTALRKGVPVTIGRAADCTITLGAMSVSRKHGRIELRGGVPMYFDEEEAAGSRVDGAFVRGATPLDEKTRLDIGGFQIQLARAAVAADAEPAPAAAPSPAAPLDEMEQLLAHKIQGVRAHREASAVDGPAQRTRFEAEWEEVVASARRIGQRYAGHPRLQMFTVARDGSEIAIKVKDGSKRGYSFFILSRAHPQGLHSYQVAAWLIQFGEVERSFREPKAALEELLHELAPRLA